MNNLSEDFSLNQLSGGYFKAPNFIFDIPISKNAKIVLVQFCRRYNKKGNCFVGQKRMGIDCGIKSVKTVRKALTELEKSGLISIKRGGIKRVHYYKLCDKIVEVVRNKSTATTNHGQKIPHTQVKNTYSDRQKLPTKEYLVKENPTKERIEDLNENDLNKRVKKHMEPLTPDERRLFDSRALGRLSIGCPSPKPNSPEMDRLRYKYLLEDE